MNVPQMKGFLRKLTKDKFKISGDIKRKIEKLHGVPMGEIHGNLESPDNLIEVETQESRRKHDETYGLCFHPITPGKTKRKKLRIVVTYKRLKKLLYIVTAHYITRKTERLSERAKAKRTLKWRK